MTTPEPPGPRPWDGMERRERAIGWHSKDVARAAALVMAIYLAMQLLWFANPLVIAAFLGVLFGLAVEAGVDRLERFRIPRGIGAALIVLGFFAFLVGVGAMMAPTLREQSTVLRTKIPEAVDRLAKDGELMGYRHHGFWSCMDTLKEKNILEEFWNSGKAPWAIWK